jgi:hypothetical protein
MVVRPESHVNQLRNARSATHDFDQDFSLDPRRVRGIQRLIRTEWLMPHEGPHLTRTKVTTDLLAFAVSQDHDVLLRVDLPGEDATVILQMKPADAREIAAALIAKAEEAEKG